MAPETGAKGVKPPGPKDPKAPRPAKEVGTKDPKAATVEVTSNVQKKTPPGPLAKDPKGPGPSATLGDNSKNKGPMGEEIPLREEEPIVLTPEAFMALQKQVETLTQQIKVQKTSTSP